MSEKIGLAGVIEAKEALEDARKIAWLLRKFLRDNDDHAAIREAVPVIALVMDSKIEEGIDHLDGVMEMYGPL